LRSAAAALDLKPDTLAAATTRLIKKQHLAKRRHGFWHGFYRVLRPEDQVAGAPDFQI